jgi:hypothetical protein
VSVDIIARSGFFDFEPFPKSNKVEFVKLSLPDDTAADPSILSKPGMKESASVIANLFRQ